MTTRSPCTECNSNDNLVTWMYEGNVFGKCMTPTCSLHKAFVKERKEHASSRTKDVPVINNTGEFLQGQYQTTRGLSVETCTKIGIQTLGATTIFEYHESQKVRYEDKTMEWKKYNKQPGLFGMKIEYSYEQPIYITEGEFDAASIVEAGFQAYSVAKGAGAAKQEIQEHLEHLSKFKEIIFFLDNDKEGKKALEQCLEIEDMPIERVRLCRADILTYKDANEALQTEREDLVQILETAEEFVPSGISTPSKEMLLETEKPRIPTPFPELNKMVIGTAQSQGELWVLLADPKIGKSTFTKKWVKDSIDQSDIKVGVAYLEEPLKNAALSFITADNEVPLANYKQDTSLISVEAFDKSYETYIETGKIKFIDLPFKKVSSMSFFTKLRYLIKKGYKFIVLDHITMLTYDMDEGENERKTIDILMKRLRGLVNELGATILVISHVKRPSTWKPKKEEDKTARTIESTEARGSGVFEQVCDVMLALERNMDSPSESIRNQLKIKVLLNRITGQTGYADSLYWITNKGIMSTLEDIFKA